MMKKTTLAVCAALLLLLLAGCSQLRTPSFPTQADSASDDLVSLSNALDLGNQYLSALTYENAVLQYAAVIERDPENKEAYAGLYSAYAALGQTEEAEKTLEKARTVFGDEDELVSQILRDADLVHTNGGGSSIFRSLSDSYIDSLDETNSALLQKVGTAWMRMEPTSPDAYLPLGILYAWQEDADGLEDLCALAEENGVEPQALDAAIVQRSNGEYSVVLSLETESVGTVEVEVAPEDDAQDVVEKVAEKAAEKAGQQAVEKSGLDDNSEAARLAQQMVDEALQKGLGALPGN